MSREYGRGKGWNPSGSQSPDYERPVFGSGGPIVMTFGQHRGKTLDQVPRSYLVWLSGLDSVDDGLRDAAVDEVMKRAAVTKILSESSGPVIPATPRPEGKRPTRAERAGMSPGDAQACRAAWRNHQ